MKFAVDSIKSCCTTKRKSSFCKHCGYRFFCFGLNEHCCCWKISLTSLESIALDRQVHTKLFTNELWGNLKRCIGESSVKSVYFVPILGHTLPSARMRSDESKQLSNFSPLFFLNFFAFYKVHLKNINRKSLHTQWTKPRTNLL